MSLKIQRTAIRASFEQELISSASEEFARDGLENFSMRKLAKKMGCAVGTLYLYFEDKQDLLQAVVEASFRILLDTLQTMPAPKSPEHFFRSAFRLYVEFGLKYPSHYRCAFALPSVSTSNKYRPHAAFDFLRERVQHGVETGLFRYRDVNVVSQIIWVSLHGLTSLLIARPNFPWAPRDKLIDALTGTVLSGLLASQPNSTAKSKRTASHPQ